MVTDLGLHLGLRIPPNCPGLAGERWSPATALLVLRSSVARSEAFLRSEIERYLSWPAQAIGYKVGARAWQTTREQVRRREGAGFDLRAFHSAALDLGLVGLQQLQDELAGRTDGRVRGERRADLEPERARLPEPARRTDGKETV